MDNADVLPFYGSSIEYTGKPNGLSFTEFPAVIHYTAHELILPIHKLYLCEPTTHCTWNK